MLFFFLWALLLGAGGADTETEMGTKVVVRYTMGDHTSEFTTYTTADQRRTESRNSVGRMNADGVMKYSDPSTNVSIQRCDLAQSFELNTNAKEYTSTAYPPKSLTPEHLAQLKEQDDAQEPLPTIRITVTTVDTGEREEMFGHVARHIITTVKQTHLDRSEQEPEESVIDGWYIDFNRRISCQTKLNGKVPIDPYIRFGVGGKWVPVAKTEYIEIGRREKGLALKESETWTGSAFGGIRNSSGSISETEVIEFVEGPVDPALFEVPAGFRRVDDIP